MANRTGRACPERNRREELIVKRWMLVCAFWTVVTLPGFPQGYDNLWKQVDALLEKDLPASAVERCTAIYAKAEAEENMAQMMRAFCYSMTVRAQISPDSLQVDVERMKAWAEREKNPCHQAVIYSIMAGKDSEHREEYLRRSLRNVDELRVFDATDLIPMVKTGEDSHRYFGNSLLDVLARRALDVLAAGNGDQTLINEIFRVLLRAYADNREASLLIRLQRLDTFGADAEGDSVERLISEYGDLEVCCEAYIRLAGTDEGRSKAQRMRLVEEGLRKYPHYKRINALKNLKQELERPFIDIAIAPMYPETTTEIKVEYCNSKGFSLLVYKLRLQPWEIDRKRVDEKNVRQYGELHASEHFDLPPTPDYEPTTTSLRFTAPQSGVYYVMMKPDEKNGETEGRTVVVSRMALIAREIGYRQMECVVLDVRSGHPLENVKVSLFRQDDTKLGRELQHGMSDGRGCVTFRETDGNVTIKAEKDGEVAMPLSYYNYYYRTRTTDTESAKRQHCWIFTDRALYRPGQTIQFSGCVFEQQGDETVVKQGGEVSVKLFDSTNTAIDSLTLAVDTMGSFDGNIRLPEKVRNGRFAIEALRYKVWVEVEEYKRPTFEIVFDKVVDAYQWGDSVDVMGVVRTLSGVPLQRAQVRYVQEMTVWMGRKSQKKGVEGILQTDDEGRFSVPLTLRGEGMDDQDRYGVCGLTVDVTSLSGESHRAKQTLRVGRNSLQMQLEVPHNRVWRKERMPRICMKVTNYDGASVPTMVEYRVAAWQDNMDWKKVQVRLMGQCESNHLFVPVEVAGLPSGKYAMKVVARDERGQEVSAETDFVLFSGSDKTVPTHDDLWTYSELDSVSGQATWWYGTKHNNAYVLTDIYDQRIRMEGSANTLKAGGVARRTCDVFSAKGNGVEVKLTMVRQGKLFAEEMEFAKPKPRKQLTLRWSSFRDKLQPGENETWTLQILRSDGTPAQVQVVATLYDASLDLLKPLGWTYSHTFSRYIPHAYMSRLYMGTTNLFSTILLSNLSLPSFQYSTLDLPSDGGLMRRYPFNRAMPKDVKIGYARAVEETAAVSSPMASAAPDGNTGEMVSESIGLRDDFSETAFFMSRLTTDERGEVARSFTLPESLTRWRFLAFAHDSLMNMGLLADEVVAQKKLMLQSQLPRFVRVGDEAEWQALISNAGKEAKQGTVMLEVLNVRDSSVVMSGQEPFDLEAGKSVAVRFRCRIPEGCEGLIVRMQADGGDCKDGEQHRVPVLDSKVTVTDTRSFTMRGKGNYNYTFDNLFNNHSNTATQKKLIVSFVDNALWYAWQALPALQKPEKENVVTLAAHYYADKMERLMGHEAGSADEVMGKLKALQQGDGGWSWCMGMLSNRVLTTQVVVMLARLHHRGADVSDMEVQLKGAMDYLRKQARQEYDEVKASKSKRAYSEETLKYIYAKVLLGIALDDGDRHCIEQAKKNPRLFTIYGKAVASYLLDAADEKKTVKGFLGSIMEYSVVTDEMGRYFDTPKAPYSWCSYRIPTQSMVIEALHSLSPNVDVEAEMKQWLLKQKQVQQWENVVATVDAVYALCNEGLWNVDSLKVSQKTYEAEVDTMRRFGYCKTTDGIGWGSVCASYEEELEKVMPEHNGLSITRSLSRNGKPVEGGLEVGDRVTVCLSVAADRDMDFVEITDERAACMEPVEALSRYEWQEKVGCYRQTTDHATHFSIDKLRKGKYTIKYDVYVTAAGAYSAGIATIRSAYASEFAGRTREMEIIVK
ncbi:MAG: alpha-2-macroglobulin family protein [Bacteroidales bacterium]|nr:alpha-2-macroglobulin family protein [Bacteroidales bacterium]